MQKQLTKREEEVSLKLTDKQRRWLDNYLEARRDFESERVYELTARTVRGPGGKWIQMFF
jgi:hypothetical protein